jgi:hypothetical protein
MKNVDIVDILQIPLQRGNAKLVTHMDEILVADRLALT